MRLIDKIRGAIESCLEDRGYDLVQVRISGGEKLTVGIDIDRLDGKFVTVKDCVESNHLISAILDVENFIERRYTLEVSSPGENRPLTKIRDFERFRGKVAKMELLSPVDGMKKFSGEILGVASDTVKIRVTEGVEVDVPFDNVKRASVRRSF